MNRVVLTLGLVVIVACAIPDLSRAHKHVPALPEDQRLSLKTTESTVFVGPVLRCEILSKRVEPQSWYRFSLTHTDIHHLPGSETHHTIPSRSSIAPDGIALMFSWPFASTPAFQLDPRTVKKELKLNVDAHETDYRPC